MSDTDQIQTGDNVAVELEGEVVDLMENHDGLLRIDVGVQEVEILHDEIIDIERPARAVDIRERSVEAETNQGGQVDE